MKVPCNVLEQHSYRSERQPSVAEAVVEHRVVTGGAGEHREHGEDEQHPANGVTWLASRDNDTHGAA